MVSAQDGLAGSAVAAVFAAGRRGTAKLGAVGSARQTAVSCSGTGAVCFSE